MGQSVMKSLKVTFLVRDTGNQLRIGICDLKDYTDMTILYTQKEQIEMESGRSALVLNFILTMVPNDADDES